MTLEISSVPARRERPHNLPQALTTFIGRELEIARARRLFGATRLLTLTGSGGVGKTRLGHEVAAAQLDICADGAWLVELASLTDPLLVPQAVAATLGLCEEPGRPLTELLIDALRHARLLLILDNCEHLVDACAELAERLLRACPDVRILATSRQALGIDGEMTLRVPSLSFDETAVRTHQLGTDGRRNARSSASAGPAQSEPIGHHNQPEAVRLFVERARATVPTFTLTDRNVATVAQICRQLDGIPLAIELAAARIAMMTPESIASRLDDQFRMLTGGNRTALPRHRTLRALIDWSHATLDDQERVLFRRLAVFAGGWSIEAAESVCADESLASSEILDVLAQLVDKSIVLTVEHADEVRYRFLGSLRAYANDQLRDAGEEVAVRERHADWVLALAEQAEPELTGPRQIRWLQQLDVDHDNIRAALAWSIEHGRVDRGVRLAGALFRFWSTRGAFSEGHRWLAMLLLDTGSQSSSPATARARARALQAASRLAAKHGDHAAARDFLAEALALAHDLDDQVLLADGTHHLGCLARVQGDLSTARALLHEARELFHQVGDAHGLADTSICLGVVVSSERSFTSAAAYFGESLDAYRRLGDQRGVAVSLNNLGEVALERGDISGAHTLAQESLTLADEIGDRERVAIALATLAGVAAAQAQPERALRLAGAATQLREALGKSSPAAWRSRFDRWLEPAHRAMTEEACRAARLTGQAMPIDQAVTYALSFNAVEIAPPAADATFRSVAPITPTMPRTPPRPAPLTSALTQRELEVVALIARGLTNRQIADELVITEGTAANHVKHILAKLVLDSRVQVATWAIERDLQWRPAS